MRKVIDGKIYNTKTAKEIDLASRGYIGDFSSFREGLYRTKKGAYFLSGEGGPSSHYAVSTGDGGYNGGSGIIPYTPAEALTWCQHYSGAATIEKEFAGLIEEA